MEKTINSANGAKSPETDDIFNYVHNIRRLSNLGSGVLRLSMNAKATIKVGPFSRGGYNRYGLRASLFRCCLRGKTDNITLKKLNHAGLPKGHQRTVCEHSLPGIGPVTWMKRPVRTRMQGVVGGGGLKSPV